MMLVTIRYNFHHSPSRSVAGALACGIGRRPWLALACLPRLPRRTPCVWVALRDRALLTRVAPLPPRSSAVSSTARTAYTQACALRVAVTVSARAQTALLLRRSTF